MSVDANIVRKVLAKVGDKLVFQLKTELENQGHIATGRLHDSIDYEIQTLGRNTVLRINAEGAPYAAIVNDGAKPHFPNIDAIIDWMDAKGISPDDGQTKKQVAYAIAKRIQIEGIPTKGSFEYSHNGKRRGFVNRVFGSNRRHIESQIVDGVAIQIETSITNTIRSINKDG
jgi:hypothetical protein